MYIKDKLNVALQKLNKLIDDGWEFPDACYKVSRETGISYEKLVDVYDLQF